MGPVRGHDRGLRRGAPRPPEDHRQGGGAGAGARRAQRRDDLRPAPDRGHPARAATRRCCPASKDKADLVEALGVDVFCVLPFTLEFMRRDPSEFVHSVLVEKLHASAVVVGENFRYGGAGAGTVAGDEPTTASAGASPSRASRCRAAATCAGARPTSARACPPVTSPAPRRLSDASTASTGIVVRGDQRGREMGYPTANLEPAALERGPADGIYAGRLVRGNGAAAAAPRSASAPTRRSRATSAASRPTSSTSTATCTASTSALAFTARLRDTLRFDGMEPAQGPDGARRRADTGRSCADHPSG